MTASIRGVVLSRIQALKDRRAEWRRRRRQQRRREEARRAYDQLRASTGRPDLDAGTSRKIRDYCTEVLGSPDFQPWMRFYALYQGRFVEGWIPDDYYNLRVLPALFHGRRPVGDKRTLSRRLFATAAFPDLAYFINGRWFSAEYELLGTDEMIDQIFDQTDEVYLKLEDVNRGKGVSRLRRADLTEIAQVLSSNAVVQRPVVQHPWFDGIYSEAVATLRITTSYLGSGGPRFRASYLRLGYAGSTCVESSRSLRWAVTDGEGTLAPEALDDAWRRHSQHPDSGFSFKDSRVPFFDKAVDTCLGLHRAIPHDQIVGWDVGITHMGDIEVMEWNSGHTDIKFSEATVGPIFADCGFERFAKGR